MLIGLVMLVREATAFAKPSRGWCTAFLAFAIATAPAAIAAIGSVDLLLSVPACASAQLAFGAAKRERPLTQQRREPIPPTIGNGLVRLNYPRPSAEPRGTADQHPTLKPRCRKPLARPAATGSGRDLVGTTPTPYA